MRTPSTQQRPLYSVQTRRFFTTAFFAGVLGSAVMSLFMWLLRSADLSPLNFETILGSMLTHNMSRGTWFTGFAWHLLNGGMIGLVYALGFKATKRVGLQSGMLFGLVNWIVAGATLGMLPGIHPLISEQAPAPGWFALNMSLFSAVAFLVAHLIYGITVGKLCENTLRREVAGETQEEEQQRRAA